MMLKNYSPRQGFLQGVGADAGTPAPAGLRVLGDVWDQWDTLGGICHLDLPRDPSAGCLLRVCLAEMVNDRRVPFELCGSGAAGFGRGLTSGKKCSPSSAVQVTREGEGDAPTGMPTWGLGCIIASSILVWEAALAPESPLPRYRSPER